MLNTSFNSPVNSHVNISNASNIRTPPPVNYLKFNSDASFDDNSKIVGVGLICRDFSGIVRGVRGIHLYGALDPENGECKALREAAICAYEMQDTKVLFKSYCFNLASSIYQRCFSWCSPVELENCK